MKKTSIIILIIFAFSTTAEATRSCNCTSYLFVHENIRLFVRSNNHNCPLLHVHHEVLAKMLNDYIKEKIANGKLENKRFEVQVWSPSTVNPKRYPHLQLTQGRNGYFVSMPTCLTSWENMRTIVHYFANPDWQPVLLPYLGNNSLYDMIDITSLDFAAVSRQISRFFEQNTVNEILDFKPVTVWERDGVSLEFSSTGLRYAIYGEPLSLVPTFGAMPVRIHNRFLFFQRNIVNNCVYEAGIVHVVEDMQTIKTWESGSLWSSYTVFWDVEVHSKWVNFSNCLDRWSYSYSYEQNRFFRVGIIK